MIELFFGLGFIALGFWVAWVLDVGFIKISGSCVWLGEVRHSSAIGRTLPWELYIVTI